MAQQPHRRTYAMGLEPRRSAESGMTTRGLQTTLTHVIAGAIDVSRQTHTLGDVVSKTPEVDDIAPRAQRGRALNQSRLEPSCFQPEGECWSGDAYSGDEN